MSTTARHTAAPRTAVRNHLPTPRRGSVTTPVGLLLATTLMVLGAVLLRDVWVGVFGAPEQAWTVRAARAVDGLAPAWWMIPAGVGAALLGVVLVIGALRPRRAAAVPVTATTTVWITPAALARIATQAAHTVPGVSSARSKASARVVRVHATVLHTDTAAPRQAITEQVERRLGGLATPVKIRVKANSEGTGS